MSAPKRELSFEGRETLARLVELAAERDRLELRIRKAVRRARSLPADVSWEDVGGALGLSRSGAQKAYAAYAPRVRNRRRKPSG